MYNPRKETEGRIGKSSYVQKNIQKMKLSS